MRRNDWFRYCRSRREHDVTDQIFLLEQEKQLLEATIADLKRLLATPDHRSDREAQADL